MSVSVCMCACRGGGVKARVPTQQLMSKQMCDCSKRVQNRSREGLRGGSEGVTEARDAASSIRTDASPRNKAHQARRGCGPSLGGGREAPPLGLGSARRPPQRQAAAKVRAFKSVRRPPAYGR
eukprot:12035772-Alexandrium_andersonii.AAC.1